MTVAKNRKSRSQRRREKAAMKTTLEVYCLFLLSSNLKTGKFRCHLGEILRYKPLGIVTMRRAVVTHKVMSQFMAQNHPPVNNGFGSIWIVALKQRLLL